MKEPEEIIEAKLTAILSAAVPALDVIGALAPCEPGEPKLAEHSNVSVVVDLASQNLDFRGPGTPCTYTARIGVNVALADDKSGLLFRDSTRSVRDALLALTGDGCAALDSEGFTCDGFTVDSTQTTLDGETAQSKVYTATLAGRYTPTNEEAE